LPAVVEPPRMGQVMIPAPPHYGADVVLAAGGKKLGVAGRPLTLSAGSHQLLLVNREVLLRVPIKVEAPAGGEARVAVTWPRLGVLTIRAAPPGGRVLVRFAGEETPEEIGVTPINRMPVVEGTYELTLEHPINGKQVVRTVTVTAGADAPAVRVGQEDWR
jgi:hypothetical protein